MSRSRFAFNGKERDSEWNSDVVYDYGFRIYDPRISRFLSVDPLTKSYPWLTPYQFASNRPIIAIDLDGLEAEDSNGENVGSDPNEATTVPVTIPPPPLSLPKTAEAIPVIPNGHIN